MNYRRFPITAYLSSKRRSERKTNTGQTKTGLSDNSSSSSSSSSNRNNSAATATTSEVVSSSSQAASASATTTTSRKTTTPPPPPPPPPPPATTTTTTTTASSWTATKFPPDQCTKEQLDATLIQLPDSLQCSRSWSKDCSYRVKTTGCQNPILAREFYASKTSSAFNNKDDQQPFIGVVLGWDGNDIPIDMLYVGSTLNPKYQSAKYKWNELLDKQDDSCRSNILSSSSSNDATTYRKAQTYVVNWDNLSSSKKNPAFNLIDLKNQPNDLKINDNDMIAYKINTYDYLGKKDAFTKLLLDNDGSKNQLQRQQPIHYLDMQRGEGLDYTILTELIPTLLTQVRFLKFEYNKEGSWKHQSLRTLLSFLKNDIESNSFICYWSGSNSNTLSTTDNNSLWRITDCFLNHYEQQQYARIQCVSSTHNDVKQLALQMEQKFLHTIYHIK
ncbi:hypothetical protein FRACYDRAFT_245909 [Fragilariopsis cylindrus CCMP1102]|uniref:Uncharacterized protein n=1 Tax=Fragilariopsis cylindrus CCMP1102 TaxID=635003 RepID=A0A1E7F016_9STRA|nr:hypothetical protein FRACYDRAFT_245909 [Fragilariopsis cylindrus CCMP1102]|eukprot:OEU11405.1 hypothetical protein FRACYDRAFT_245909 [Fragilariopsis cylindrus CCMP1102]